MNKRRRSKELYMCPAYYEGQWVNVPMFYVPEEAINDDRLSYFRFIPVDGQKLPDPPPKRSCEAAYAYINSNIKRTVLPWMLSQKKLKELCTRNDIPIAWVIERSKKNQDKFYQESGRRDQRKCSPIDNSEYKAFIKELGKLSATAKVIAEIQWFLNKKLYKGNDYVTLEEILRLDIEKIDVEDGFSRCITLFRSSQKSCHMVTHWLPNKIWKELNKQLNPDSLFAFSNKNRGPLLPGDIDRLFKKAGRNAGIQRPVTSLSLRPLTNTNPLVTVNRTRREVSIDQWKILCQKIPGLKSKLGRPSKHDPRLILNAIFLNLDNKISIRKMPPGYPPAKAFHSQYRRWKKNGIFNEILRILR